MCTRYTILVAPSMTCAPERHRLLLVSHKKISSVEWHKKVTAHHKERNNRHRRISSSTPLWRSLALMMTVLPWSWDGFGRGDEACVFLVVVARTDASTSLPRVKRGDIIFIVNSGSLGPCPRAPVTSGCVRGSYSNHCEDPE